MHIPNHQGNLVDLQLPWNNTTCSSQNHKLSLAPENQYMVEPTTTRAEKTGQLKYVVTECGMTFCCPHLNYQVVKEQKADFSFGIMIVNIWKEHNHFQNTPNYTYHYQHSPPAPFQPFPSKYQEPRRMVALIHQNFDHLQRCKYLAAYSGHVHFVMLLAMWGIQALDIWFRNIRMVQYPRQNV